MKTSAVLGALGALTAFYAASVSAKPLPLALPEPAAAAEPLTLAPLHPDVLDHATGLRRRAAGRDYSKLKLREKTTLVYGTKSERGQFYLANMTLYGPHGMRVVNMEVFDDLTSKVDCKGDDGELSLTFKDKEALTYALKEWSWINEKEKDKFVIVANHKGCGPDDERQAYIIHKVDQVAGTLKTRLLGKPAPWSDVAETFELDFGSVAVRKIRKRGWLKDALDKLGDIAQGAVDTVASVFDRLGDANVDRTFTFGVAAGTPGKRTNIFADHPSTPVVKLDCVNCYVKGSFKLTGHLKVDNFKPKQLTLDASPQNLAALVELEAALKVGANAPGKKKSWSQAKELFSAPIPGVGIKIPKIFKLGGSIELDLTAGAQIGGEGSFTFGVGASVPNSARVTIDVLNPSSSSQSGLAVNFEPKFRVNSLKGSVGVSAAAVPKVTFGVEIVKVGKLDAYLALKLPEVAANLNTVNSCAGGSNRGGARLTSTIAIGATVGTEAKLGSRGVSPKKDLFTLKKNLLDKCFSF